MRIIILHQFFYPDHSAVSQLMTDLAESLTQRGVEVTALAGRGRYNGGEALPPREEYRGIRIERAWATSYGKSSDVGRLADYLSFYFGAAWKLLCMPRHDIVVALTTPPLISLLALLVVRLRRMRMIVLVQDIYPDVAVAVGTLKAHSLVTKALDWLNRLALRGADRIIVLSECMRERVAPKVGEKASLSIDVIPNWADGELIKPLENRENPFARKHNLENSFVVLFSGNFGLVNEFQTVLKAADRLRGRTDIVFLFIGDGARKHEIEDFVRRHDLENVRIMPYEQRDLVPYSLAAGDALLVTLREGMAGLSVPSKTYAILAAGRPVLFVGDKQSDVARLIAKHECGEVVASGDDARLAAVITDWAANTAKAVGMERRAREVFERRFDRHHAVDAYLESFSKCIGIDPGTLDSPVKKPRN